MKQYQISGSKLRLPSSLVLVLILFTGTSLLAQTDSVIVNALNPVTGAASLYSIEFTLSDTLFSNAEFEITFPADFDVSNVTIAGSKVINGGFAVGVKEQKVSVKRKGRGAIKLPGERVNLMFSTVKNPARPDINHKINIIIKNLREAARTKKLSGSVLILDKKVQ